MFCRVETLFQICSWRCERVRKRRLNAYGSALTHSASCWTPVPREPTLFSHFVKQLASKMMEGWPTAQHHDRLAGSPELQPLASDLQAYGWRLTRGWLWGLDEWVLAPHQQLYVCLCVRAHRVSFRAPFSLIWVTGGTKGKVTVGHSDKQNETSSFSSAYTQ